MKKLFSCLLIIALLLSFSITAKADDNTSGSDKSPIKVVPSEADLPEGYVIDPDYSFTFTIDAENGWTYKLEDLIGSDGDDEYIYFIVEENVADGYTPEYNQGNTGSARRARSRDSSESERSQGNVVVVKNIKEGDGPVYELPKTGGIGTTIYTVVGAGVLLIAAAYGMFLLHKRKKSA